MTEVLAKMADLDKEIASLIALGEKDPSTIVEKLEKMHGEAWLREQVAMFAHDVATQMARAAVGSQRRALERRISPGDKMTSAEMKGAGIWVPGPDGHRVWKKAGEATAADLRAKAAWYERLALGSMKRATWCRDVADKMDAEGVATLGKLRGELPPLPEEPDVELPALAAAAA